MATGGRHHGRAHLHNGRLYRSQRRHQSVRRDGDRGFQRGFDKNRVDDGRHRTSSACRHRPDFRHACGGRDPAIYGYHHSRQPERHLVSEWRRWREQRGRNHHASRALYRAAGAGPGRARLHYRGLAIRYRGVCDCSRKLDILEFFAAKLLRIFAPWKRPQRPSVARRKLHRGCTGKLRRESKTSIMESTWCRPRCPSRAHTPLVRTAAAASRSTTGSTAIRRRKYLDVQRGHRVHPASADGGVGHVCGRQRRSRSSGHDFVQDRPFSRRVHVRLFRSRRRHKTDFQRGRIFRRWRGRRRGEPAQEDVNDNGTLTSITPTFSFQSVGANSRGLATLNGASYSFYMISAARVQFIAIGNPASAVTPASRHCRRRVFQPGLAGRKFAADHQRQQHHRPHFHRGQFLFAANPNQITAGVLNQNNSGNVTSANFSGTYAVAANGRGTATLSTGQTYVFYLIGVNQAVIQETDNSIVS